jgi:hypothetical protein
MTWNTLYINLVINKSRKEKVMKGRKKLILSEDEKQSRRTLQNRINKRIQRIRDKNKKDIPIHLSKEEKNKEYINNLTTYFNTFEFNIHFTGTFEPKKSNKISLQSLKSYTDKFIQLLIDENIIEYGLIFLDTGENENNHTHIVIKSNPNIKNIESLLKSKWLLGSNVDVRVLETENHKLNTIKYGFNKMGNSKKNKGQEIKKGLWNLI